MERALLGPTHLPEGPVDTNMRLLRYGFMQPNDWTCVPAATRIILHNFGLNQSVSAIAKEMGTVRGGTTESALIRFMKKKGLKFTIKRKAGLKDIGVRLKNGKMILVSYWIPFYKEYHIAIVKKVTAKRIYFHDTWFGSSHSYSLEYFKLQWKKDDNWMLTIKK
ncbi:MAG: cysteine peptidase family C39 domain-containing protein [bacterium]|nr:cysteine peptidase family C39 domain-containing protein [bacterium]